MNFAIDFETAFGILQHVYDAACYYTTIEQRRRKPKFSDEVIEMKHHPVREWFRKNRRCEICGKRANLGVTINKGVRCKTHMEDWMEDVMKKKCLREGCQTTAQYGHLGESPQFCDEHKTPGMKNLKNMRNLLKKIILFG